MKRLIFCQADTRDKIMHRLDSHAEPCIKELAKLYLFPHFIESHIHWSEEIWAHYSYIGKMKSTNRPPKADFIYQNIWLDNIECVDSSWTKAIIDERPLKPDDSRLRNQSEFIEICEEYFLWVAETLSKNSEIKINQVQSKLRELKLLN